MPGMEGIFLWSLGLSFLFALLYRVLTKPQESKRLKEEVKLYREKIKKAQKESPGEANKLLSEMMKLNQKQLRMNMKPMIASLLVFFVVIGFLREAYSSAVIQLPFPLPLPSYTTIFGFLPFLNIGIRESIGWFWWYVLITLPATFLFRKLLGVE